MEQSHINNFIALSRYAGSRFDLVQAGGGNSSVKLDDQRMLVKASGFSLSEVGPGSGYASVNYPRVVEILQDTTKWDDSDKSIRDHNIAQLVAAVTLTPERRASIEVFLHAVLDRFVLHTHPVAVNVIASRDDWHQNLSSLFTDALCVGYRTPGIELGSELFEQLGSYFSSHSHPPHVVFLQNHGLIVSAGTAEEVQRLTEDVVIKCEQFCRLDFSRYRAVSKITEYVGESLISYLCEDRVICDLIETDAALLAIKPVCPDDFVYCGVVPLILGNELDPAKLSAYMAAYRDKPKVIGFGGNLYFVAHSIKKARETEEVFKSHLLTLSSLAIKAAPLSDNELAYLGNWEAEKFRSSK